MESIFFLSESQVDNHMQEEQANDLNPLQTDVLDGNTEPYVEDSDQSQPIGSRTNLDLQINKMLEGEKRLLINQEYYNIIKLK